MGSVSLFERDMQMSLRFILNVSSLNGIAFNFQAFDAAFSSSVKSLQLTQFFRVTRFYAGHLFRKEMNTCGQHILLCCQLFVTLDPTKKILEQSRREKRAMIARGQSVKSQKKKSPKADASK